MPKETLCSKFHIIKGDNCRQLLKEKVVYMEEGKYSTSAMVIGGGKYSSDKMFEVYEPDIGEFMYYFVKGGRTNAKNIAKNFININN